MEKEGPKLDVAYHNKGSKLNTESGEYVLTACISAGGQLDTKNMEDLQKMAKERTAHFQIAIESFVEHHPMPDSLTSFNIRDSHSWVEVMAQVESAKQVYEDKAKGKSGALVQAGRYVSENTNSINPWLEFIPNSDYSSVICGGLKFIFGAAAAQAEVRRRIMEAIDSIPDYIEETYAYVIRFSHVIDEEMRQKLEERALRLYIGVLAAIEGMLQWLEERAISALNLALNEDIYSQSLETADRVNDLREDIAALRAKSGMLAVLRDDSKTLRSLAQESQWRMTQVEKRIEDIGQTQNAIMEMQMRQELWNRQLARQSAPTQVVIVVQQPQKRVTTRRQLQAVIGISVQSQEFVLEQIRSVSRSHAVGGGDMVKRAIQIHKFREWLQSDKSQVLLLRSPGEPSLITTLSDLCATLMISLRDLEPAITLHYFCGIHHQESQTSSCHLLRTLLVQLLEVWPAEQTFTLDLDMALLSNHDFGALWRLFLAAMMSLPGATVFCIIDGALRYPVDELNYTVLHLCGLTQSLPSTTKFKLLMTSPVPKSLLDQIPEESQVFIADTGTHNRQGSLLPTWVISFLKKLMAYVYEPLSQDYHTRVLELYPALDKSAPLCGKFRYVNLEVDPFYDAISYTWGAPDFTEKITIDENFHLRITPNLHHALTRYRHVTETRSIWADAICINQKDEEDKRRQVPLMTEIYRSASSVLVWLGKYPKGEACLRKIALLSQKKGGPAGLADITATLTELVSIPCISVLASDGATPESCLEGTFIAIHFTPPHPEGDVGRAHSHEFPKQRRIRGSEHGDS
ncbi:hypothetical protein ONZ43_g1137 [Nemania bipapillata]|uniref:Uncharacterized protein n=1 Tax=Nemania bipapillata TaxID=110536 RepID=A0ACC2J5W9_9PEZI|nr:hypothetical protein ONZ43_g1137 [Nemania bipapillata]